jgi:hypothetical protein
VVWCLTSGDNDDDNDATKRGAMSWRVGDNCVGDNCVGDRLEKLGDRPRWRLGTMIFRPDIQRGELQNAIANTQVRSSAEYPT